MAKTKKESAKNIRDKMVFGSSFNAEEEVEKNIQTAKDITVISTSIERLSEDQVEIFEKILSALEEIPKSVSGRDRQNEKVSLQIAKAILSLERQIEKETDKNKITELQTIVKNLTEKGESLSKPSSRTGLSLLEGIGKKYLGFQSQDIEEMRSRGGGLGGMFGAYVPAVKRGFNILAGRNTRNSSFQSKLNNLRAIESASSEISDSIPRTGLRSGSIKEKIRDRAEKNVEILLKQIAANTEKTAKLLKRGTEDSSTAGTDYDPENKNNAAEVGGMGGSFSVTQAAADMIDAVLPDTFVPVVSGGSNKGTAPTAPTRSQRASMQPRDPRTGRFVRASASAPAAVAQGGRFSRMMLRTGGAGTIGRALGPAAMTATGIYSAYAGRKQANEAYEMGQISDAQRREEIGQTTLGAILGTAGGILGAGLGLVGSGGLASGALAIGGSYVGSMVGNYIGRSIAPKIEEATTEQTRAYNANALEEQAMRINGENSVINNIDNSQVVNNYATSGSDGQKYGSVSISVRNDESSYMRFQNRRLSRVM